MNLSMRYNPNTLNIVLYHFKRSVLPILLLAILATGCKTQLAPEYDKAIVEKVTATSEKTMSFLETISNGTSNETYTQREDTYNSLIGAYEALKLQAKARPIPKNTATEKINKLLQAKGSNRLSSDYPSAFAFEEISKTLKKMKEVDQQNGIKPIAVEAFKGQIEIFLDQAITYESFLKR